MSFSVFHAQASSVTVIQPLGNYDYSQLTGVGQTLCEREHREEKWELYL